MGSFFNLSYLIYYFWTHTSFLWLQVVDRVDGCYVKMFSQYSQKLSGNHLIVLCVHKVRHTLTYNRIIKSFQMFLFKCFCQLGAWIIRHNSEYEEDHWTPGC